MCGCSGDCVIVYESDMYHVFYVVVGVLNMMFRMLLVVNDSDVVSCFSYVVNECGWCVGTSGNPFKVYIKVGLVFCCNRFAVGEEDKFCMIEVKVFR